MKNLVYATTITLVLASLFPTAQARNLMDYNVTHLGDSAAIPNNARIQGATHQLDVYVKVQALSSLSIDLPEDISIRRGIEVKNQSGQKIEADVSINNRKAKVVFSQPVPPETKLSINMRGVITPGYDHIWLYRIYGKMVGANAEIPLGTAWIPTYK
ncbi:hypothetical protein NIES2119_17700 [[Phormidium ambiguum] IAM M-71]|uniref:DUF2808 domain-containing protein n=1 Tax=[Phormidium ambiguum] IAM M-71 TaxID=454136 RepID=A0A1U7IGF0_9CYAN|nr:DUF2808 domain-containing protein [Phormidium ambiguum]OKH36156.1 hypothetical protein NIES2119_17700 [Phormidium ambiguum IAM M-71]